MFAETTRLLYSTIPETIKIYQDTCDDELFINGDSSLLHQVMMNLVGNACDAVEGVDEPLIKLKLDVYQPDRVFAASYPDAEGKVFAHLSVEDNGYGILEDDIEHIFEPFYTTKEVGKGSGLGLSMVFGAVKTHDGFVQLESSKDNGAIFHIYIFH
ncbi:sensor histidine kinase [Mariprofundus sp. EBB-1]|uniref:sensor histidine kinase n=1 Tax=Mariprofundus sp. EBB-1 TaxID=2650971 RepID=UPI000EF18A53|nr:ATP-binding protein [Mariprofundus sp. EBB-1]RLL48950.1 sensor histidine kinase [Mariprofundus sp. EBB-1]